MGEQEEKERLIKLMGSQNETIAVKAVNRLRKRGWLTDGSLCGEKAENGIRTHFNWSGARLYEADLHEADLQRTALIGANLRSANLRGADLREAVLGEADLSYADLSEANLQGAWLQNANFHGADLTGANLGRAILGGASFHEATLDNIDLTEAKIEYVSFSRVDLSTAKGLDTVVHFSPSSIGVDTLILSEGKIPEVFLRGCGVPEEIIAYLPAFMNNALDFYSCFISYSHADQSFARRIHDTLQGGGIRCWLDEHQMLPGDPIHESIDRGIRIWDKVLLCCSEASMKSWWVEREFNKALQKEEELSKRRNKKVYVLVPLDLDGYIFSDVCDNWIARTAKERLAANFQGWEHNNALFEREIERLIRALRTNGSKEPPPEPKL